MGVTKRNSFDFNSLQLQQTHRKCHHRQSSGMIGEPITTRATILPPHAVYNKNSNNNSEHKKKQSLPLTVTATIATPNQQQFSQKHQRKSQPHSHTSATPVVIPRGQVNAKNCCSTETNARTTNGESEFKSTTEILNRPETVILSQKYKENKSLNRLAVAGKSGGRHLLKWGSLQLNCRKHMWLSVAIALICLSSSVICQNPLKGSALPLLATTATTLSLATRGSMLVAGASTYEPIIKYDIVHREDDGMTVEDIDVNSNEQQLLAYYKKAQKEHEDELRRQRQMQMQQQYKHHHQERDIERETLRPALHFDDIIPTVDVISSLSLVEDSSKQKKSTASKRSTTKRSSPTSPVPTSTLSPVVSSTVATSTATPASKAATTTTAKVLTTATPEEKCEPKVLDEIPAEPYYDFADIAEDAARKFAEFLSVRFPTSPPAVITDEIRDEVRRRANSIASSALNEDEHLLAFALAAPSTHTVVVKFKDNVTIPPDQVHNRGFLGSYWRELGHAWNSTEGSQEWGAPFRDCNLLVNRWLWPFRISLVESKFKIVAAAFIAADEDVCNDGLEQIFGRKHGCDRNTTFCLLTENKPAATRDVYTCICRESYYLPNSTLQGFRGDIVEMSEGFDNYSCIPCPAGCSNCDSNGVCLFGEDQEAVSLESLLKVSVGSVLGACILCCLVLSIIVFRQRKCKAIASGMWTVLETILLGIVLLYASVAIHFFPASTERCIIEPWLRELGFITCYGAIILKLYRHLVDFRTRKAHRWVLRDVDLLKYLGTMVFAVACYMAAFTASSLDLLKIANLDSLREVNTNTCQPLNWEYVTQHSEILILIFGLHLAYASRNANTQFRERQFLEITLIIEFVVSSVFYILRYLYLPVMSPSAIFLALFIRSQLTNTIALGLIFVPKLWYQHKQVRSLAHDLSLRLPVDAFKGSHDVGQRLGGGYAGLCLGDPDIGELTISEMSPEDIRAELKRLYTQLEILKNKTLRQDNPHISKRRGGRKAGHRRFSLQALSAKHRSNKHHQDIEITEAEPSRTPEDSVCSNEGPTDTYAEISGISHSMLSHSVVSHSMASHNK
ncbi:probable G-protein coupled receptor 158 isoform X2 [Musca domestica]|uniref:Probable G-protein coupled receptor 158 isoform X2 n=1 Tax=Musca domestica TaxID=7370 RepID=A0A9J7DHC1_MUSDO|nr:probable G-protein coupled receptor 158 isoform X2 [Musca domestica]